jgi:RecA-family ATPase
MRNNNINNGILDLKSCIEEEPPVLDFVLDGLLAGTVGGIVAAGSTGKGFLGLELGIDLTSGANMLGLGINYHSSQVMYLTAEDPAVILQTRIHAMGKHLNQDQRERMYEQFIVRSAQGRSVSLLDERLNRNHQLIEEMKESMMGKRLVIMDTLRRFHSADENSSAHMSEMINVIENIAAETGAAVLFSHHVNKSSIVSGQGGEQEAARGSSAITDNIRWQVNLTKMNEKKGKEFGVNEDLRDNFVCLQGSKLNYGNSYKKSQWLRRVDGGVLVPAVLEKKKSEYGARS